MSYYAEECYNVYSEECVRARKRHTCSACNRTIEPGHRYVRVRWIYDGGRDGCKRCGACQTVHLHLRALGWERDLWPDEKLDCGLDYRQEWETDPPERIARLPFISGAEASALLDEHPQESDDSYDIRGI